MNKMVMAVIPRDEAEVVLDALLDAGFFTVFMETKGGVLRQSKYTLFAVIPEEELEAVINLIKENCAKEIELDANDLTKQEILKNSGRKKFGNTVVFAWDLDRLEIFQ